MLLQAKNLLSRIDFAFRKPTVASIEHDEAVRRWKVVLDADPTDVSAAQNLIAASASFDVENATSKTIRDLEEKFPNVVEISLVIARHYQSAGQLEAARAKWNAIVETNKQNTEALNALGYVHLKLDEPAETLNYADKLDDLENTKHMSLKLRVHACFQMEKWEDALEYCQASVALRPDDTDAISLLITGYFKCSMFDAAYKLFCSTYPDDIDDPKKLITKQQLLMKLDNWQGALAVNDVMVQLKKNDRNVLYDRAIIFLKIGRLEQCDEICSKVLKTDPQDLQFTKLSAQIGQAFVSAMRAA